MDSLLAQTYEETEVIVIDDASTDTSWAVLQKYRENVKVTLIRNERNLGWVKTSNLGLNLAKGKYVMFANCDDFSDKNQISLLVEFFEKNEEITAAFSSSYIVDEEGKKLDVDFDSRPRKFQKLCAVDCVIKQEDMLGFLFHFIVIPNLSAVLFRKLSLLEVKGFSTSVEIAADWELYFRISALGPIGFVREPLNYFRSHNHSIRKKTKHSEMQIDILKNLYLKYSNLTCGFPDKQRYQFSISTFAAISMQELSLESYKLSIKLAKFLMNKNRSFGVPLLFQMSKQIIRLILRDLRIMIWQRGKLL
jgi:glycosyltransferase involved in cell wall biosynthesis